MRDFDSQNKKKKCFTLNSSQKKREVDNKKTNIEADIKFDIDLD